MKIQEILLACRMFSRVQPEGFARLVGMARLCRFAAGESVFRQGQDCPGIFVVGSGLVRVFKIAANGKEHVLHMVGPGNTFAEVAALGGFACPAHAESVAPTVCVLLPADRICKAIEEDHPLCVELLQGLTVWVRHLVDLVEDVVLRDAIGRIARYLLGVEADSQGTIELPTLKRYVANHLNLTSETFSRTIRRLTDAGLVVQTEPAKLRLLDRDQLRRIAEGLHEEFSR